MVAWLESLAADRASAAGLSAAAAAPAQGQEVSDKRQAMTSVKSDAIALVTGGRLGGGAERRGEPQERRVEGR